MQRLCAFCSPKDIICFCLFSDHRPPLIVIVVTVPINQEQPQADRQDLRTESYIWRVVLSPAFNRLKSLLEYLKVQLGISVANCSIGSLMITVTCSSLQLLEDLWGDYSSGHLNKVVEQTLVTPDVLEKLGLSELKLKTTISKEECDKCKEFFLGKHQVRGSVCLQNDANKFIKI